MLEGEKPICLGMLATSPGQWPKVHGLRSNRWFTVF